MKKTLRGWLLVKKVAFTTICALLVTGLLYGCGKSSDSTDRDQKDPAERVTIGQSEKNPIESIFGDQSDEDSTEKVPTSQAEEETIESVKSSQVQQDVIARQEVQSCFSAKFTDESSCELEQYELIKEQINIDDKEDLVYAAVCIKNAYFKMDLNVKCVYNYYDKGGWIMDEFAIESIENITPVGSPNKQIVSNYIVDYDVVDNQFYGDVLCSYMGKNRNLTGGTLTFSDLKLDGFDAVLYTRYQTDVLTVEGRYTLRFEENDWHIINEEDDGVCMEMVSYDADYSCALGEFELQSDFSALDPAKYYGSLKINKIDNGSANYDLYFWLANDCGATEGQNLKGTFDELTGTLRIGSYLSGDDMCLRYDSELDCWVEGMYNRFVR